MLTHMKFQDLDTMTCQFVQYRTLDFGHTSTRATDGNYLKNFYQPVQKKGAKRKRRTKLEWQLQSFLRCTQTQQEWQMQSFLRYMQTQWNNFISFSSM